MVREASREEGRVDVRAAAADDVTASLMKPQYIPVEIMIMIVDFYK